MVGGQYGAHPEKKIFGPFKFVWKTKMRLYQINLLCFIAALLHIEKQNDISFGPKIFLIIGQCRMQD
jgi:hypothetical protein